MKLKKTNNRIDPSLIGFISSQFTKFLQGDWRVQIINTNKGTKIVG